MAAYLKSLTPAKGPALQQQAERSAATTAKLTAAKDLTLGKRLYIDNCGACHFDSGEGAQRVFPRLDGASLVNAANADALLHVILAGTRRRRPSVRRRCCQCPASQSAWTIPRWRSWRSSCVMDGRISLRR